MICPVCNVEFRGGAFYRTGLPHGQYLRECPNGHEFPEPPKVRKPSQHELRVNQLEKVLRKIQQLIHETLNS